MITFKMVLDTRRAKADGKFPIMFRITHDRKTSNYSTGISVFNYHWNPTKGLITKQCPNSGELNTLLLHKFTTIQKLIIKLDQDGLFSFDHFKELLYNKPKAEEAKQTFFNFAQQLIDEMLIVKRTGNAIVYQTAVNRVLKFCGNNTLSFESIDYTFLDKFAQQLTKQGIKPNSISNYFRSIRAIFNKAIKAKIIAREAYPFGDIQIKTHKTAKRALASIDLANVYNVTYKPNTAKWHAKNFFLLSFCLRGISFTDLAYLKLKNIGKGRINYSRRKTKAILNIQLTPLAEQILSYYSTDNNTYLLPVLSDAIAEDSMEAKRVIYQWIKTTNKWLFQIARDVEIDTSLTTYVTRHTWATMAKRLNFTNEMIAEGLGHQYGNSITNIYLADFDNSQIDNMNTRIVLCIQPCKLMVKSYCKYTFKQFNYQKYQYLKGNSFSNYNRLVTPLIQLT